MLQAENEFVEYKEKLTDSIEKESVDISKSLINIESPEQELTFAELFIHYHRFGKPLNDNTFAKTLNFLTKDKKYNYLAYLMADNNQLSVRFARFNDAGKRFELIEKGMEYGNGCLITAIQRVLDRFEIENITLSKLTGAAHRIDKRLVDSKCLREVIINAFAHNDYSYGMLPIFEVFQDRFAVRSYGGLVPQLTINDFFLGVSALRNPELMRILKDVELVEALGYGIREITKVYDRSIFEFTDNTVYTQVPFDEKVAESLGKSKSEGKEENWKKIVNLMKVNPLITILDMSIHTGLSIGGTEKVIRQLKSEGKISRKGSKKDGFWIVGENENEVRNKVRNKVRNNASDRLIVNVLDGDKVDNKATNKATNKVTNKVRNKTSDKLVINVLGGDKVTNKVYNRVDNKVRSKTSDKLIVNVLNGDKVTNKVTNKVDNKVRNKTSDRLIVNVLNGDKVTNKVPNKVTNKVRNKANKVTNKNAEGILKLMMRNPEIITSEIAKKVGLSDSGAKKIIRKLKSEGKISRKGSKKYSLWVVENSKE